ncbi:hypothetical protein ACXEGP_002444 [Klebsiella quasipneumoniae]
MPVDKSILSFQEFIPDTKDICTLCGGNYGDFAMVACKDGMYVCMDCIDVLSDTKKERESRKREELAKALHIAAGAAPIDLGGIGPLYLELADKIIAGEIPHLKIV